MAFSDYNLAPSANTTIGDAIFIGPNMERGKVREALQQIAADGKALSDAVYSLTGVDVLYYATRAAGAAATVTDKVFSSNEEGQLAVYLRTAVAPYYSKLYEVVTQDNIDDAVDVVTSDLASNATAKGGGLVKVSHNAVYGVGTLGKRFQQVITPQDHPFLAVGDGATDDTAALTAWVNALNNLADQSPGPIGGFLPLGRFKYTSALPNITNSVTIFSDNARQGTLVPVGDFSSGNADKPGGALVFRGDAAAIGRLGQAGLASVRIDSAGMTGGYSMVIDWTQDFLGSDVLISDSWNGIYLRQSGDPRLLAIRVDRPRGPISWLAEAKGGKIGGVAQPLRNGESDQINALVLDMTVNGLYVPGNAGTAVTDGIIFDGYIHTVRATSCVSLNNKTGIILRNSFGTDQKYAPSFFTGKYESEQTHNIGIDVQAANRFDPDDCFAASSSTKSGIVIGDTVDGANIKGGSGRSNGEHGLLIKPGAKKVVVFGLEANLNSPSGAGIRDESTEGATIIAARCGGGRDGIAETQAVGVQGTGTAPTRVFMSDLSGNATSAIGNNVLATDCKGVSYTVSTLPTGALAGARAYVTDATVTTFASVVAGGGANKVPVVYDGAAWRIG